METNWSAPKNILIKTAKQIIQQNSCNGIKCMDCPAPNINNGGSDCEFLFGSNLDTKWFVDYLKNNDMNKIQHTAEEWISIIDDLNWNPDVMVKLRSEGYVVESVVENKEIFKSDDELRRTLLQIIPFEFVSIIPEQFIHICKEKASEYNLIHKSMVEKAEEMYTGLETAMPREDLIRMIHIFYEAIQYIKSENERLKKQ